MQSIIETLAKADLTATCRNCRKSFTLHEANLYEGSNTPDIAITIQNKMDADLIARQDAVVKAVTKTDSTEDTSYKLTVAKNLREKIALHKAFSGKAKIYDVLSSPIHLISRSPDNIAFTQITSAQKLTLTPQLKQIKECIADGHVHARSSE